MGGVHAHRSVKLGRTLPKELLDRTGRLMMGCPGIQGGEAASRTDWWCTCFVWVHPHPDIQGALFWGFFLSGKVSAFGNALPWGLAASRTISGVAQHRNLFQSDESPHMAWFWALAAVTRFFVPHGSIGAVFLGKGKRCSGMQHAENESIGGTLDVCQAVVLYLPSRADHVLLSAECCSFGDGGIMHSALCKAPQSTWHWSHCRHHFSAFNQDKYCHPPARNAVCCST